jgi:dienelactone hydrolase
MLWPTSYGQDDEPLYGVVLQERITMGSHSSAASWKRARSIIIAAAVVVTIAPWSSQASGQAATIQLFPIPTVTMSGPQFLTGSKDGKPAVVAGELRIPTGMDRVPAVVIVHGGVGVGDHEDNWAREFNEMGVAAFILDSFTGRGAADTRANLAQVSVFESLGDAYRALELLSKHPRIDPTRIAVMGFSRGAFVSVYSSSKRFQALSGSPDNEFAAYVGFYTPCGTTYIDDEDVSSKPIRLFHGISDDWVPVEHCRQYVQRLRKAGKDVTLTEYPNAYHRFDDLGLKTSVFLPQGQTPRRCVLEEKPAGKIIHQKTGAPFVADDPCMEKGVTVALNAPAQASSLLAVKDFLRETFKIK